MNKASDITVIDDKNLRGVVAPSSAISDEVLEDMIDLVEMSDPKFVAKINRAFKKAKGEKLTDGRELRKQLGV